MQNNEELLNFDATKIFPLFLSFFFPGLALLQKCRPFTQSHEESLEIPPERVHEAAVFHQFAEAAYTVL